MTLSWFDLIAISCVIGVLLLAAAALLIGAWIGCADEIEKWRCRRAIKRRQDERSHIVGNVITYNRGRR